jgi:hypothetical protein
MFAVFPPIGLMAAGSFWNVVMCQDGGTDSNVAHGTPQYVFDAMKAAG